MHSLERELAELRAAGGVDEVTAAQLLARERGRTFSVFVELRAALYVAVALVIGGIGLLVKEHLDRIGPLTLIFALAFAAAACYLPAIRAHVRAKARSNAADYFLLLGALIVSADLAYAESQFHVLGEHWSRHLLLISAFHAFTAYALGSRLVLSVALTTLATWFGVERGPGSLMGWQFATPALGLRALVCAAVILAWRQYDQRFNSARFRVVLEHFAANLAFWGVLGWCWDPHLRILGVAALLAIAAMAIRWALHSEQEVFAVYGVGYTALGLGGIAAQITDFEVLGAVLILAIVSTAVAVLRNLHDRLKKASA